MLTAIELKNYRRHTDTKVPLERFTLLVGDNAVGKTSVLEAVSLVGQALDSALAEPFFGSTDITFLKRHGTTEVTQVTLKGRASVGWSFSLRFPLTKFIPRIEFTSSREGELEKDGSWTSAARAALGWPTFPPDPSLSPAPTILRLEPRRLAEPSTSDDLVPTLAPNGEGFATALKHIKATDDARYRSLEEAARSVVPSLVALSFRRVQQVLHRSRLMTVDGQQITVPEQINVVADELLLKFTDTDWLPAHAASEGTLLALGVLTRLYEPAAPRVLLLDDIARALHPRAQGEFIARLRAALDQLPDAQIIATAHSPYLADHFAPEAVVVLGRPDGGPVVARRLSEHPDQRLREAMTTGEFLTASGSGWFWQ